MKWSTHHAMCVVLFLIGCASAFWGCSSSTLEEPNIVSSQSQNGHMVPSGATGDRKGLSGLQMAPSETCGYSEADPICVGGAAAGQGPSNSRQFLNSIVGPQGQPITYSRKGACCPFETVNSDLGGGLLDVYEVRWDGQAEPVILYVNMYDAEPLWVPHGLRPR
ncbi:MAG: hypothetical protein AAF481_09915 [Acidobacteriota bacterium]